MEQESNINHSKEDRKNNGPHTTEIMDSKHQHFDNNENVSNKKSNAINQDIIMKETTTFHNSTQSKAEYNEEKDVNVNFKKPEINANSSKNSELFSAAYNGWTVKCKQLIKKGANVNHRVIS